MSHTQVREIVKQAVDDRDGAVDHLDATIRALKLAWDPPALPPAADPYADYARDDEDERWDQEEAAGEDRRAYMRRKSCSVCGKPSRRLVRRWQAGRSIIAADRDDPARDQYGHVKDLDEPPHYSLQPSWAVCGTAHARTVIEEDRAAPKGSWVPGREEFYYAVESFRYVPHDTELPRPLRQLRNSTDLIGYTRERLERAVAAGDAAGAAVDVASLRRDIARAAAALAAIGTHTPAPRTFAPGDPAPGDDVFQVRIGDTIYRHWPVIADNPHMKDHWTGPTDKRCTWDELTEVGRRRPRRDPRKVVASHDDGRTQINSSAVHPDGLWQQRCVPDSAVATRALHLLRKESSTGRRLPAALRVRALAQPDHGRGLRPAQDPGQRRCRITT